MNQNEQTFVIIKPDAIERGFVGKIIERFENMGLCIKRIEKRRKNVDWCREQYLHVYIAQCRGEYIDPVYSYLEAFITSDFTISIILIGHNAIERVRKMIGATNTLEAEPGTIRGDWGKYSGPFNLIHASDSKEAVDKEIKLYFNKETDQ